MKKSSLLKDIFSGKHKTEDEARVRRLLGKHINKASINRAIKHLGLEIWNNRGDDCSYFLSLETGDQVGEGIYLCYMNQQSIEAWVKDVEYALEQENNQ